MDHVGTLVCQKESRICIPASASTASSDHERVARGPGPAPRRLGMVELVESRRAPIRSTSTPTSGSAGASRHGAGSGGKPARARVTAIWARTPTSRGVKRRR